jgi:hypothetical protein
LWIKAIYQGWPICIQRHPRTFLSNFRAASFKVIASGFSSVSSAAIVQAYSPPVPFDLFAV